MFPWVFFVIIVLICMIQNIGPLLGPIVGIAAVAFGAYHGLKEQNSQANKVAGWAFVAFGLGLLYLLL